MDAPSHFRWITPWHWPRPVIWSIAVMTLLSPLIYLLSFPPVTYFLLAMGVKDDQVALAIQQLYFPALALADRYDAVLIVFEREFRHLESAFGPMNGKL